MKITYDKIAIKHIKQLDRTTKERVLEAVLKLPQGDVIKLKGFENRYRLRIGNFRVIYNKYENEIVIADCLPRGEAYKRS
ncbi:MAG: type II toxin-antitoxin system RelE/ParE family toxin [Oscillospiraceae bacterium]|nr:type II toxin-antitoxin system RelE/ParE family toxin [Oscillospiraceae bacterium]